MKRQRIAKVSLILILAATLSVRTYAVLGIGDIVFDPTSYAQAVKQLIQMEQQYEQLVQSYRMLRSQYEHIVWMARRVPVDMVARYRAPATPWQAFSAGNTYGATGPWIAAMRTGLGVSGAYASATELLKDYDEAMSKIPAGQLDRVKTGYGTVELTDGANVNALETIGRLRANAPTVEAAIARLEDDSLSSAPEMNTEIAVLNKINAAQLLSMRTAQDANKLLVALAEQQVLDAKRTRDAEARAINAHIQFVTEGRAVLIAQASGASAAMRDWHMP